MDIAHKQYNIPLCPSPSKRPGISYRTPRGMWEEYDAETNRLTVHIPLLPAGHVLPDIICDIGLCPQGQQCGCFYEADLGWEIGETLCTCKLYWIWPSDPG